MKKHLPILSDCMLFAGIEPENLLAMLQCMGAQLIRVSRNQTVFHEGDPATHVGIVLSGRVQVVRYAPGGSMSILSNFGPPQVFGTAFACAQVDTLPLCVLAVQDSELLLIDCKRILTVCSNACLFHSRMISNLLRIVAQRSILFSQKLEVVTQRTTRDKLMTFLIDYTQDTASSRFAIPYNRQQLADYLGVSRCAMVTEMGRMKREGLIDFDGNEFEILHLPFHHRD